MGRRDSPPSGFVFIPKDPWDFTMETFSRGVIPAFASKIQEYDVEIADPDAAILASVKEVKDFVLQSDENGFPLLPDRTLPLSGVVSDDEDANNTEVGDNDQTKKTKAARQKGLHVKTVRRIIRLFIQMHYSMSTRRCRLQTV